jgi:hypothetical protein
MTTHCLANGAHYLLTMRGIANETSNPMMETCSLTHMSGVTSNNPRDIRQRAPPDVKARGLGGKMPDRTEQKLLV